MQLPLENKKSKIRTSQEEGLVPACPIQVAAGASPLPDLFYSVVGQFENTPPALANFSSGLERSDNPGYKFKIHAIP